MGKQVRLIITGVASCGLAAGLSVGLQFGAGFDSGVASAYGVGLLTFLGALGTAWIQLVDDSSRGSMGGSAPDTGTLKGVTRIFADRMDEWADVSAVVRRSRSRRGARVALVIYGMPGVGKSEFALHAAHKLVVEFSRYARRKGLSMVARQVELYGLEGLGRTDPRDALRELLDLDDEDPRRARLDLDGLSAEWRKHLQGKFLVLLLDNADDEAQVLPFLPGGSPYILLITSRRALQGQISTEITPYHLNVLPQGGATQMINNIVGRPLGDGDQETIAEIALLCGYHPLAIKQAMSILARKPSFSFAGRLAQIKKHDNRLLAIDEYAKESGKVAKSFDLSYTQLSDAAKLVLRRLSLAPVPAVSVEAAIALADLSADVVTASLRELSEESLIEDAAGIYESYRMHDLIRHYARSLASRDDPAMNQSAISRLLAYYWGAATYADSLLTRQPTPEAIEPPLPSVRHSFAGLPSVIEWVRAELPNLLACADYAVQRAEVSDQREDNAWVVFFARALAGILRNEGQWRRSIELQTQAVKSAEKIHIPMAVANALSERGMLHRLTAELSLAVADLERAISIYHEFGNAVAQIGEAHALNTYGVVLDQLGKKDDGLRRLSEGLDIYRRLHYPLGEANILHDQGMAEFFGGNHDMAVQLLGQALELYETVDHPLGMAHAHSNLARAQHSVGDGRAAADNLQSARVLYADLGNQLGVISVLVRLGAILRQDDFSRAAQVLNEALRLGTDIGNQLARIDALDELGEVYMANGDQKSATDTWSRALQIARDHGVTREAAKLMDKVRRVR